MSRIEQLIGEIEQYLDSCKAQAFSNSKRIVVEKDVIEEMLVELRMRTPEEIKKYQKIIASKEAILADAQEKADEMVGDAHRMTENMVSEHEIMSQAQAQADDLMARAQQEVNRLMDEAQMQAQQMIDQTAEQVKQMMSRAQMQANQQVEQAQMQAQQMVDQAQMEANRVLEGAIRYTDNQLAIMDRVLTGTMENTRSRYEAFMGQLQGSLDVVRTNRSQLGMPEEPVRKATPARGQDSFHIDIALDSDQ